MLRGGAGDPAIAHGVQPALGALLALVRVPRAAARAAGSAQLLRALLGRARCGEPRAQRRALGVLQRVLDGGADGEAGPPALPIPPGELVSRVLAAVEAAQSTEARLAAALVLATLTARRETCGAMAAVRGASVRRALLLPVGVPPPPPSRTKWTCPVHPSVLIGRRSQVTVTDGAPGAEWAAAAAAASDTDAATGLWAVGNLACVDAAAREACLHTPRLPARLGELLSAAAAAAATAAPGAGAGAGAGVAAAAAAAIRNLTAGGGAAGGGLLGAVPGLVASLAALAVVAEERALRADEAGAAAAHSVPGAGAGEAAPGDGVAERAWEEVSHALGALCNLTTAVPGNVRPPAPLHSLLPHSHRATRPPPSRARRRSSRFTLSRRPPPPPPVQSGHVSSIPPY